MLVVGIIWWLGAGAWWLRRDSIKKNWVNRGFGLYMPTDNRLRPDQADIAFKLVIGVMVTVGLVFIVGSLVFGEPDLQPRG